MTKTTTTATMTYGTCSTCREAITPKAHPTSVYTIHVHSEPASRDVCGVCLFMMTDVVLTVVGERAVPTTVTTATVVVQPGMERRVRELRAQLATINDNIDSMNATIVRIGDRDWSDPRIAKIEADIERAKADKEPVRAKIEACMMVLPTLEQIIAAGHVA